MHTIKVTDETYKLIKDQLIKEGGVLKNEELKDIHSYDSMIGQKYFFRTVTYHLIGKVKKHFGYFLELEDAVWVADSGRFMNAIRDGKLNEVEPVGTAWINMHSVTDFFPWKHPIKLEQK